MTKLVLICEDEQSTLRTLEKVVSSMGFTTICVPDGMTAIKVIKNNKNIDLFITDMGLPDVDGIEVLNAALDKANNVIPTLVVSGIIKPSGISALLELGVSRVLPKPIERTELIQAIQKTIV